MRIKFNSLLYKTNRFHVAVRLFSNRSQKTSKCGKNISDKLGYRLGCHFFVLTYFDVICDLLLNRRMATWNLWNLNNLGYYIIVNFVTLLVRPNIQGMSNIWLRFLISNADYILCTIHYILCHLGSTCSLFTST